MTWICPCGTSNGDERQSCQRCGYIQRAPEVLPSVPLQTGRPRRRQGANPAIIVVGLLAIVIGASPNFCGASHTPNTATHPSSTSELKRSSQAPDGHTDVRPFVGALSDYPRYPVTAEVSIGQWSYKLIRQAALFPTVYRPHREFQPEIGGGLRLGDTKTAVRVIELLVRNDADASNTFPVLTMISDSDSRAGELLEFAQFSAGYIDRHLDSSVVFGPGEQLRGVIAFECCLNPTADSQVFLRVPGGYQSGKSALISLSSPPAPPSHQVCTHIDSTSPYSVGGTTCKTVLDSDESSPTSNCNAPNVWCAPSNTTQGTSGDTPPALPMSPATIPSVQPTNAASPTSGLLCKGIIGVPESRQLTFPNLPDDHLKFTFDHDAWQPTIRREPDGTKTLVMRFLKAGSQVACDIRWEIAP